jgi:hypothetical protein
VGFHECGGEPLDSGATELISWWEGWTVFIWIRIGHGNEPFVSIKDVEFIDYLSNYQLFKKDCALGSYFLLCLLTFVKPSSL